MKCIKIKKQEGGYLMTVKNKTLVKNMEHVKWKEIPPLKGPDSQGLNVSLKQSTTIENSIRTRNDRITSWTRRY
jgi:hypothetical protein